MSGPPTRPPRPFGVTVISVAVAFWGALWTIIGLTEPTTMGTVATAVGIGTLLLGIALFYRHPLSWLAGLLTLSIGVLWFVWGTIEGRTGAPFGAIGALLAAVYLVVRRDAF